MTDVFLSYAKQDREVASRLAADLGRQGWSVFWDRKIEPGAEWNDEIQTQIGATKCVCVLWSRAACASFWVRGEAAFAYERGVYLPVSLDDGPPPRLFAHVQAASLAGWVRGNDPEALERVRAAVKARVGATEAFGILEPVAPDEPVLAKHLHLVHSCWRVTRPSKYGTMPFQIHVVLVGHASALDRVEQVTYMLPGYPKDHQRQTSRARERLFELKELAMGFTIVQAEVGIRGQDKGVMLSRLVNMTESGPRLLDDFGGRPGISRLAEKLESPAELLRRAREVVVGRRREEAMQMLLAEGYKRYMAEAALDQVFGRDG